jgi:hypothetical protein
VATVETGTGSTVIGTGFCLSAILVTGTGLAALGVRVA